MLKFRFQKFGEKQHIRIRGYYSEAKTKHVRLVTRNTEMRCCMDPKNPEQISKACFFQK